MREVSGDRDRIGPATPIRDEDHPIGSLREGAARKSGARGPRFVVDSDCSTTATSGHDRTAPTEKASLREAVDETTDQVSADGLREPSASPDGVRLGSPRRHQR